MNLRDFWEICFPKHKLIELTPEDADPNDPKYQDIDRYLPKEISDLYRTLDRTSEETRREVGKIAMMLTPTFWHSDLDELMTMRRHLDGNRAVANAEKNPYLAMEPVGKMWALIQRKFVDDEGLPKREKRALEGSQAKAMLHKMRISRRQGLGSLCFPMRQSTYCVPVSSVRLWSHLPERHRSSPTIRRTTCSVCTSRNSTGREFTRSTSRPM